MDFIYNKICMGFMEKRKPAYGPYIQKLINAKCGEEIMQNYPVFHPKKFTPTFIHGPEIPQFAKAKARMTHTSSGSSSGSQ